MRGRNLLSIVDLAPDELPSLVGIAQQLKAAGRAQLELLRGKTLAMLFEKPSLRTRVSFEVGMTQLGGHAIAATGNDFLVGSRETPEDAACVLSRFVDAIVVRTHAHEPLQRFAASATVPTINGLSAAAHPCQALADMLTIKERFGTLAGLRIAYVGDGRNNVAHSVGEAAAMSGMSVTFASPTTHRPPDAFLARLVELGKPHHVTARAFTSPIRAVRDSTSSIPTSGRRWAKRRSSSATPPRWHPIASIRRYWGPRRRTRCSCTVCPLIAAKKSAPPLSTVRTVWFSIRPKTDCTRKKRCCLP